MSALRLALCQLNPTVGDIAGNERAIAAALDEARGAGAGLAVFGELAVTGYPPEDLLYKEHFLRDARDAVDRLAEQTHGIVAVVGFPDRADDVYNAAAVLADGRVAGIYHKVHLPNYGVFDEQRYFRSGAGAGIIELGEHRVGVTICEDIWQPGPPCSDAALAGATLVVNLSASPYHAGKGLERETLVTQRARENVAALAFCAIVGGQDELVFDGHSFVVDHEGTLLARAAQFEEDLLICDVDLDAPAVARRRTSGHRSLAKDHTPAAVLARLPAPAPPAQRAQPAIAPLLEPQPAEVYAALVTGLRDYVSKNGFRHVVLGLSGGIDSALVATIAVDALGADRVSVAVMPSGFSSSATQSDARDSAQRLGVDQLELPIASVMEAYDALLATPFEGRTPDVTEENLQARIRGNLLMALSNKFGWLVLTTGNKSEMSVGYSTLYGDSAGGFAVIKDIEKTLVYALARWRNTGPDAPIAESIIDRAPSAELRADQRDEDSLPPYAVLDEILRGYVEEDCGRETLIARGLPAADVDRVIALVDGAEYKRRQAPPGIKITERAFGRDRRMPITNRYRG